MTEDDLLREVNKIASGFLLDIAADEVPEGAYEAAVDAATAVCGDRDVALRILVMVLAAIAIQAVERLGEPEGLDRQTILFEENYKIVFPDA